MAYYDGQKRIGAIATLAGIAGILYGIFLAGLLFGASLIVFCLGGVVGFIFVSQALMRMALATGAIIIGVISDSSAWTEARADQAAKATEIVLVILIVAMIFGLLFTPMR